MTVHYSAIYPVNTALSFTALLGANTATHVLNGWIQALAIAN